MNGQDAFQRKCPASCVIGVLNEENLKTKGEIEYSLLFMLKIFSLV